MVGNEYWKEESCDSWVIYRVELHFSTPSFGFICPLLSHPFLRVPLIRWIVFVKKLSIVVFKLQLCLEWTKDIGRLVIYGLKIGPLAIIWLFPNFNKLRNSSWRYRTIHYVASRFETFNWTYKYNIYRNYANKLSYWLIMSHSYNKPAKKCMPNVV